MTAASLSIDSHAHVFRQDLGLAPNRRYAPAFDAPLEIYLAELDRNGLSHGVLVQPSFLGTDNSYLLASLARAGKRLRGVAVVGPGAAREELRGLAEAGIVGIRLNLVGQRLPDLEAGHWQQLLAAAAELGWHIELHRRAADLPQLIPPLFDAGVSIVIDHFGLPDPALGATDPGFRSLLSYGPSGRVWVKLSAPYRLGSKGGERAGLLMPHLRGAFGCQRLMWGSDWPHTQFEGTQSYLDSRQFLDGLAREASEVDDILASPSRLLRFA